MSEESLLSQTPQEFLLSKGVVNEETRKIALERTNNCYKDIISLLDFYFDMPIENMKIIATWIIGTYVHKEFNSFPFLFINAMRGSGKTRLLNFISALAWKGKITNNITEAVLFRTAKNHTLIIDENESIINKEKSVLRELLNSAYKKGSMVERMKKIRHKEGEDLIVEKFELYTPIAMANISGMEEVLGDRCVTMILEKSSNAGKIKLIEDFGGNEIFTTLQKQLLESQCSLCSVVSLRKLKKGWNNYISEQYNNYIHTLTTLTTQTTQTTQLDEEELKLYKKIDSLNISGRNLELFFPLIILTDILDPSRVDEILEVAKTNIKEKMNFEVADSPDISLYQYISMKDPLTWYSVGDLLREFKTYYTADEGDRDWLNNKWLGRALRRLKLVVNDRRRSSGMEMILNISKAVEKSKMFINPDEDESETKKDEKNNK